MNLSQRQRIGPYEDSGAAWRRRHGRRVSCTRCAPGARRRAQSAARRRRNRSRAPGAIQARGARCRRAQPSSHRHDLVLRNLAVRDREAQRPHQASLRRHHGAGRTIDDLQATAAANWANRSPDTLDPASELKLLRQCRSSGSTPPKPSPKNVSKTPVECGFLPAVSPAKEMRHERKGHSEG